MTSSRRHVQKRAAFFFPLGVSYHDCGYSVRYQARKNQATKKKRKTKMENAKTLEDLLASPEDLFTALMEAYPANDGETDK
ncbi:MAG: hypothetical protein [Bacteriophage sp.]|nr:MAG: hypothetical protein [Bacteriophage sp.]